EVRPASDSDGLLVRVLDEAGAVLAGTTHLPEFASGLTGENPHFGDVVHPSDSGRTSGGSSSGSAAAVASGIVPLAVGSDTGGSIRVPAAFCGIYGMRLTPQHPWISDAFPLSRTFDTAGWFTATPADMLTTLTTLVGSSSSRRALNGVYLGFDEWVDADGDCAQALDAAGQSYAPKADQSTRNELLAGFRGSSEAYTVLHSFDAFQVHQSWIDTHKARYGTEVWQRLDRGRKWTDREIEAAHVKLVALRLLWSRFFQTFDFLVMPATPFPALEKGAYTQEIRRRLLDLTSPASLGGLPVLTVPVHLGSGFTSGLQIVVSSPISPAIPMILSREQSVAFSA
ncbi:MAG: amidase, partial [Opitutaceae bacterium]|nr:amidase [Opitutaceae bacterium]